MAMVTKEKKSITVQAASQALGVSPDTVRRWHKKGLIRASIGANGERLFDAEELSRVHNRNKDDSGEWRQFKTAPGHLSLIELFCGAGGLALGLSNAGLNAKLLVDNEKNAIETLKLNRPDWNSVCCSVTDLDLSQYRDKIDVMTGGFPCQAFSYAGNKMGFEDTRGTLFYDFARLIKQVNPKIVIGENVKGLISHDNGNTLKTMIAVLEDLGYSVRYRVLRSQFLDVPQKRERLIIMGLRKDLDLQHVFPEEKDYIVNLRNALKNVPAELGAKYNESKKAIMNQIPEGGYWKDLPDEMQRSYMGASYFLGGGKTGMARRLSWDEPSLTLTCNPAQKQTERCHPSETRPLTTREYARIQTFPDSWQFVGSLGSIYKQIGNAVPVNLGYQIGLAIRAVLGEDVSKAEGRANHAVVS